MASIFQQYELYVRSLEKVDDLRAKASKLLVTLNSAIFGAFAYGLFELINADNMNWKNVFHAWPVGIIIGLAGCALSILWIIMICDYAKLYDIKSKVVRKLEGKMKISIYTREWDIVKGNKFKFGKFKSILNWERWLAAIFLFIYGTIAIFSALIWCRHC